MIKAVITIMVVFSSGFGQPLVDALKPLSPFVNKTWRGTFIHSEQDKPMQDVARWESALKGHAVRILHSINQGEYGGETLVYWNKENEQLDYYYFTTAGFMTRGVITIDDSTYQSIEEVSGSAGGVTKARSTGTLLPDGRMHNKAEFFKHGQWVLVHEIIYVVDNEAQVVLD